MSAHVPPIPPRQSPASPGGASTAGPRGSYSPTGDFSGRNGAAEPTSHRRLLIPSCTRNDASRRIRTKGGSPLLYFPHLPSFFPKNSDRMDVIRILALYLQKIDLLPNILVLETSHHQICCDPSWNPVTASTRDKSFSPPWIRPSRNISTSFTKMRRTTPPPSSSSSKRRRPRSTICFAGNPI